MTSTWIVVAGDPGIDRLVGTARAAGGDVTAVVAGDRACADAVATRGVDRVLWLGEPGDAPLEAFAGPVADAVAAASPDLVLAAAGDAERALLGAVAAATGAPVLTLATEVTPGRITHATFGGIAQETVVADGPLLVLLDGGAGAGPGPGPAPGASGPAVRIDEVSARPASGLRIVETRPAAGERVNITRATRIVAVGRGLRSLEDLPLVEALAARLGAEVACSRPLADGLGWFPHDRYVGLTGQHVAPELYVALGISGQLQHVVGCRGAGTVVVVNSDADAPYFSECDFGVVGDLAAVLPALTAALG